MAVYTDSEIKIVFDKKVKAFYPGRKLKNAAKSHIIMLDSDAETLKFYEDNKERLTNRSIYIGLREIEYGLIREEDLKIAFFDINGAISRLLWKQINLWGRSDDKISVVIWCRFYYLNYWTYGEPLDGRNKDVDKRIHRCLCPYDRLTQEDKDKDRIVIKEVREGI